MAVSKAKKNEQLAALEAHLKEAKSVAFTSNKKITVAEVSSLKGDLRAQNALFLIVKKTLIRIAFKNVYSVDLDLDTLPGQVALVIAKQDALAPLATTQKYTHEWRKEEKMVFVGGYMDGRMLDASETKKLAMLPSREVLLGKLLGSLMSPLSGLTRFFDGARKELESKTLSKVSDLASLMQKSDEEKTVVTPSCEETPEESTTQDSPPSE